MPLVTYEDATKRLQMFLGGATSTQVREDVKLAVSLAYEGLSKAHQWRYYRRPWGFTTDAYISTTATYAHSTLKATLATAAPTWAIYGELTMNSIVADVDSVATSTNPATLVMGADLNFGASIADSTTADLYRTHWTLPENFRSIHAPLTGDGTSQQLRYISPADYRSLAHSGSPIGDPAYYTIMQDPDFIGRLAMFLFPAPITAVSYRTIIGTAPRPLWFTGTESAARAGTLTCSSGSRQVQGNSTNIDIARMEGSVVRFGDTLKTPTDQHGDSPYINQRVISSINAADGADAFRVDTAVSQTFTAVKYTISDPLDMDPIMLNAFYARCRLELADLRPETQGRNYAMLKDNYEELFDEAKAADHKVSDLRRPGGGLPRLHFPEMTATDDTEYL